MCNAPAGQEYAGGWKMTMIGGDGILLTEDQAESIAAMLETSKFISLKGNLIATHQIVRVEPLYQHKQKTPEEEASLQKRLDDFQITKKTNV